MLAEDLQQVWNVFLDLHNARGNGGFGPDPITAIQISCTLDFHLVDDLLERKRYYTLIKAIDYEWRKMMDKKDGNS